MRAGAGQDIEWAFLDEKPYLLQTRPITTSTTTLEGHTPVNSRLEHTLRNDLIEHFPAPFPLDLHAVQKIQNAIQDLMHTAGLRAAPSTSLLHGDDDGIIRITITKPRPTLAILTRLPALFTKGMRHDPSTWPDEETALRKHLKQLTDQVNELTTAQDNAVLTVVNEAIEQAATITTDRLFNQPAP